MTLRKPAAFRNELRHGRRTTSVALLASLFALPALAQPAPLPLAPAEAQAKGIALQLNDLEQSGPLCRLTVLIKNGLDVAIGELALEVVRFDGDGRVSGFLTLKTGALPVNKRRVRSFDLPDFQCDSIGELLLNDVTECTGDGLSPERCLAALEVTTRLTRVPFGL